VVVCFVSVFVVVPVVPVVLVAVVIVDGGVPPVSVVSVDIVADVPVVSVDIVPVVPVIEVSVVDIVELVLLVDEVSVATALVSVTLLLFVSLLQA
jgi:hypothetical protein